MTHLNPAPIMLWVGVAIAVGGEYGVSAGGLALAVGAIISGIADQFDGGRRYS